MSAQKIATGLALGGLTGLFLWVGLPALLPPPSVPEITIVVPAAEVEGSPRDEVAPADTRKPAPPTDVRPDDDDAGGDDSDDDGGDSGGGDDDGDDDSSDSSDSDSDDDGDDDSDDDSDDDGDD
jgi:hypothetical protein